MSVKAKLLLSDVRVSGITVNSGDRILVRVSSELTSYQESNIKRSVSKFFNNEVRILIVNCIRSKLMKKSKEGKIERLADVSWIKSQSNNPGVANISCSVIEFNDGDQLIYTCKEVEDIQNPNNTHLIVNHLKCWLREWAGRDVEIIIAKEI